MANTMPAPRSKAVAPQSRPPVAKKADPEFGFALPDDSADADLFEGDGKPQHPMLYWSTGDPRNDEPGYFWLKQDQVPVCPPGWEADEVRLGEIARNAPKTAIWKAYLTRAVLLGHRQRVRVTDASDRMWVFPPFTPKTRCVDSDGNQLAVQKYQSQGQVMLLVFGMDTPVVLSVNGVARGYSWSNNPNSNAKFPDFGWGVKEIVAKYAADAAKKFDVANLPTYCMWHVDLLPATDADGVIAFAAVHENTYVSFFTASMAVGGDTGLDTRYVGPDLFPTMKLLRTEIAVGWENEWKTIDPAQQGKQSGNNRTIEVAEDTIPF